MWRKRTLSIVAVAFCALILTSGAWAKTIYVDDDAPPAGDGTSWATAFQSLAYALLEARVPEKPVEVHVAAGLHKPQYPATNSHDEICFELWDGVSLLGGYAGLGASDPNERDIETYETILSGDLLGNDDVEGIDLTDAASVREEATLDDNGLVIRIYGSGIRLDGCVITAGGSGALEIWDGSDTPGGLTISQCTFHDNYSNLRAAPGGAGAITLMNLAREDVLIERCSFIRNAGGSGGAVQGRNFVLDHCRFVENYTSGNGGASTVRDCSFKDCVFIKNRAKSAGGALYVYSPGKTSVTGCAFEGNSAGASGGAIWASGSGATDISESTFIGNIASARGGVGYHDDGDICLSRCILVGNQAGREGGAWAAGYSASLTLVNDTVLGNLSPTDTFLTIGYNSEYYTTYVTVSNCLLPDGNVEILDNDSRVEISYSGIGENISASETASGFLVLGPGNIEVDPRFVDPGYSDDNGTADDSNDDFFVEGDYHLKSQGGRWDSASESWVQDEATSPCIDAGDPNSPIMYEPFPNGGIINMGAYGGTAEASKSYFGASVCETIIAGDINGDGKVDIHDLILLIDHWTEP